MRRKRLNCTRLLFENCPRIAVKGHIFDDFAPFLLQSQSFHEFLCISTAICINVQNMHYVDYSKGLSRVCHPGFVGASKGPGLWAIGKPNLHCNDAAGNLYIRLEAIALWMEAIQ